MSYLSFFFLNFVGPHLAADPLWPDRHRHQVSPDMSHQQGEDGIPHAEELQVGKEPTQIRILRWIGDGE